MVALILPEPIFHQNCRFNIFLAIYGCWPIYYVTRDHRKQNERIFFSFQGVTEPLTSLLANTNLLIGLLIYYCLSNMWSKKPYQWGLVRWPTKQTKLLISFVIRIDSLKFLQFSKTHLYTPKFQFLHAKQSKIQKNKKK